MKSNIPHSSAPTNQFNPNGSDLLYEKYSYGLNNQYQYQQPLQQVPQQSYTYQDSESIFAFLAPSENPELPELDFPVPGPDVIPDMVFETELSEEIRESSQVVTPTNTYYSPQQPHLQTPENIQSTLVEPEDSTDRSTPVSDPLIPIQSNYIAHARVGALSMAAIQERRMRNTQSARRSRARRADKISELREENKKLVAQNKHLTGENMRLQKLVDVLQSKASGVVSDVKSELHESPYESF